MKPFRDVAHVHADRGVNRPAYLQLLETDQAASYRTLQLFAHGTWATYQGELYGLARERASRVICGTARRQAFEVCSQSEFEVVQELKTNTCP